MFTETEILLAADRFHIRKTERGVRLRLATDFMPADTELISVNECLVGVRKALDTGHRVLIEVSNGSSYLPAAAST